MDLCRRGRHQDVIIALLPESQAIERANVVQVIPEHKTQIRDPRRLIGSFCRSTNSASASLFLAGLFW
jgi:hypothetical protein